MAGIYIHIPFCKSKCCYCNFFSVASLKRKEEFLDALLTEIILRKEYLEDEIVNTVYFGGGTPSLLDLKDITKIFDEISKNYNLDNNAEITLEANPDDIDFHKLKEYKSIPVNRLSIGIQSFHPEDLDYLTRIHNSSQSIKALEAAIKAGYKNISADLIYGIPGQDKKRWKNNIQTLLDFSIPHISAYSLTVEAATALDNRIRKGIVIPPDDNLSIEHFMILTELMEGEKYIHYEISNFAIEGFYSIHNSNYWNGGKYLGLGPSAHSYNTTHRQWNISSIQEYVKHLKNKNIPCEKETLSAKQKFNEYFMISIRTSKGCDLEYINKNFGSAYYSYCIENAVRWQDSGHLYLSENMIELTKKGKLFADKIASDMFLE
jgi:oxygen-independent coproporphyrinogen-3 oxidase